MITLLSITVTVTNLQFQFQAVVYYHLLTCSALVPTVGILATWQVTAISGHKIIGSDKFGTVTVNLFAPFFKGVYIKYE